MKKKVIEESVLFISIVKWLFLASCIGAIVGLSTSIFLKFLEIGIALATSFKYYFVGIPFTGLPTRSCGLGFSSPKTLDYVLIRNRIKDNCILEILPYTTYWG